MPQQVIIVDDADINLILFEALVKKLGPFEVFTFVHPLEGLKHALQQPPDLVIVDYMMPALDGIGFVQALRQAPGLDSVPVLMITANEQKQVRYRALDIGVTDFLTKPVDKIEFLARVRNLLALSLTRKQLADRATWLAEEVRKATAEIVERERETVIRLSKAAEYRDNETGAHLLRMAYYSEMIGRRLGLSAGEQELLLEAAPLHDIGKVGIADQILLKPGRLTEQEFEAMKQHAQYGYEILQGSASKVLRAGADIALAHHEKFDGTGYPRGLHGHTIPIFSRIVAVADVFDALTSIRPYKPAWTLEAARDHLRAHAGSHFDPACVEAFVQGWPEVLAVRDRFAAANAMAGAWGQPAD